jgi:hypothetical protein
MLPARGVSLALLASLLAVPACGGGKKKDKTPAWQKAPTAFDPAKAEGLTFNAKGLEAFNALVGEQRDAFVESLKAQTGAFKGQAVFKQGLALGEKMDDAVHGRYEVVAEVPDPVLFEIVLGYRLYCEPELAKDIGPNSYIEFTGTLADLAFQADAKPRRLDLKVKVDKITVLGQ